MASSTGRPHGSFRPTKNVGQEIKKPPPEGPHQNFAQTMIDGAIDDDEIIFFGENLTALEL